MTAIPVLEIQRAVMAALMEDLALGDPTTTSLIPADRQGRVTMVAREPGVVSGIEVAEAAFLAHDSTLSTTPLLSDGTTVEGQTATAEHFVKAVQPAESVSLGQVDKARVHRPSHRRPPS